MLVFVCILCSSVFSNRSRYSVTLNLIQRSLESLTAYFSIHEPLCCLFKLGYPQTLCLTSTNTNTRTHTHTHTQSSTLKCHWQCNRTSASQCSWVGHKWQNIRLISPYILFWKYNVRIWLEINTLKTGLLNCLNARSRGLTFRHRASSI